MMAQLLPLVTMTVNSQGWQQVTASLDHRKCLSVILCFTSLSGWELRLVIGCNYGNQKQRNISGSIFRSQFKYSLTHSPIFLFWEYMFWFHAWLFCWPNSNWIYAIDATWYGWSVEVFVVCLKILESTNIQTLHKCLNEKEGVWGEEM